MKMWRFIVCAFAIAAAGCAASQNAPVDSVLSAHGGPGGVRVSMASGVSPNASTTHRIIWTFFSNQPQPQLSSGAVPLISGEGVTPVDGTTQNMILEAATVRIHANMAWVMVSPGGASQPNELLIFRLPLTTASIPLYYDTLENTAFGVHMAFDSHGNLWTSSLGYHRLTPQVNEYSGDFFEEGATLTPALTLNVGFTSPQGLGFDKNGRLYVADDGDSRIAVFAQPIQNAQPYYLEGVNNPGGIIFNKAGDLFAASNGSPGSIEEFLSTDLQSGDTPSIVDTTGIKSGEYGSDLGFNAAGNLFDGDCGNNPGIYTWQLSTKAFSSTLAPSYYTNKVIIKDGCVWGIALLN